MVFFVPEEMISPKIQGWVENGIATISNMGPFYLQSRYRYFPQNLQKNRISSQFQTYSWDRILSVCEFMMVFNVLCQHTWMVDSMNDAKVTDLILA